MKRILRFALMLLGTMMLLISGLIALLSPRPVPPFYVAYVERGEAGQIVYLARTDGADARALTPRHQNSWSPVWSPDGNRLALLSEDIQSGTLLKVVTLQPERSTALLSRQRYLLSPAWSPNGEWIAFSALKNGRFSIFRASVDEPGVHQLTHGSGSDFHPAWSPDGKWLAFVSNRDNQDGYDIYRVRTDDSADPERMTFAPDTAKRSLQWSLDGDYIAFIAREDDARHSLYTLQVNTGQLVRLTEVYVSEKDWQLGWSNDGKWLYILKNANGEPVWHRIQADGENLMLMPGMENFPAPAWSPSEERSRTGLFIALLMNTTVGSLLIVLQTRPVTSTPRRPPAG